MKRRLTIAFIAVAGACLALAATALAVSMIAIYSNNMDSPNRRAQIVKVSGRNCDRGGSPQALKVEVGKRTPECSYRTPVVGRDLEIFAIARLLSGTPERKRKRIYLAVNLRAGGGASYQLAVFPLQRKWQLRKNLPDGSRQFLAHGERVKRIKAVNKANKLRLRALNLTDTRDRDDVRLVVFIGDKKFASVIDREAGELEGRYASFSVGSRRNAATAIASFDDVVVRVPDPFDTR